MLLSRRIIECSKWNNLSDRYRPQTHIFSPNFCRHSLCESLEVNEFQNEQQQQQKTAVRNNVIQSNLANGARIHQAFFHGEAPNGSPFLLGVTVFFSNAKCTLPTICKVIAIQCNLRVSLFIGSEPTKLGSCAVRSLVMVTLAPYIQNQNNIQIESETKSCWMMMGERMRRRREKNVRQIRSNCLFQLSTPKSYYLLCNTNCFSFFLNFQSLSKRLLLEYLDAK